MKKTKGKGKSALFTNHCLHVNDTCVLHSNIAQQWLPWWPMNGLHFKISYCPSAGKREHRTNDSAAWPNRSHWTAGRRPETAIYTYDPGRTDASLLRPAFRTLQRVSFDSASSGNSRRSRLSCGWWSVALRWPASESGSYPLVYHSGWADCSRSLRRSHPNANFRDSFEDPLRTWTLDDRCQICRPSKCSRPGGPEWWCRSRCLVPATVSPLRLLAPS